MSFSLRDEVDWARPLLFLLLLPVLPISEFRVCSAQEMRRLHRGPLSK